MPASSDSRLVRRFVAPLAHRLARVAFAVAVGCATSAQGAPPMDDRFDGTAFDACRWDDASHIGTVAQSDALVLSTPGTSTYSSARVLTQARLVGDFDIQVAWRRVSGFAPPPVPSGGDFAQLRVAFGLWWDEARYLEFARMSTHAGEGLSAFSSIPGSAAPLWQNSSAESGTMRLVRSGGRVRLLHSTGGAFAELGTIEVPATPVFVYLETANVNVARALSARFDDFVVNAGVNDDFRWAQPHFYSKRQAFALGGVSENWPALRYFGNSLAGGDVLALLRQNGMEWMRVGVTTQSHPVLDATPPQQWNSLPWNDGYWGSREYAARTLRDAKDRGMRLYAYLYFSDRAANWGNQPAPPAWAGKSVAETAALMEQHAYDTATYFQSKGLEVEIYELGNEIDVGMTGFVPGFRIPIPPGVNFVGDRVWLRENVWSIQATLLKAAAAGIRRAAPNAHIAVHAASVESGSGQQMGPDFFRAMREYGVDYDIAAISHPYAQGDRAWKLSHYATACWQKRVARIVDQIAVPGKPVMVVEASYQSSPEGLVSAPMPAFPFTEQGQADFLREMLRFASGHPSIVGWFAFYPEFQAGITSPADPGLVLQHGSMIRTNLEPRPSVLELRANLGPPSGNTVEYHHAGIDHYFMTADPDEIAGIDAGAYGGVWKRTGQTFMTHQQPAVGTVPVCRFYSTAYGSKAAHFYTADAAECAWVKLNPNWQFEKIAFHIPIPDASGACPAGTQPVHRMFNRGQTGAPNHRFTTDPAIRDQFVNARGFAPEGVAMCAPY